MLAVSILAQDNSPKAPTSGPMASGPSPATPPVAEPPESPNHNPEMNVNLIPTNAAIIPTNEMMIPTNAMIMPTNEMVISTNSSYTDVTTNAPRHHHWWQWR